jgi:hypothetical protein
MKKIYLLVSVLALGFFLSGMSKPVDKEMLPTSDGQKSAQRKAHYTKPHAGIYLDYQRPRNLQVGDNLELELSFKVRDQAEQLQIKLSVGDILLLQSDSQFEFDTQANKQNSVVILATALKEGATRINLDATILVAGRYQSRSFSIPVIVGDPARFKSAVTGVVISRPGYTVDKEHGVVSMPAVESAE